MGGDRKNPEVFVLDELLSAGDKIRENLLCLYDTISDKISQKVVIDHDLRQPYKQAKMKTTSLDLLPVVREVLSAELTLIEHHVERAHDQFMQAVAKSNKKQSVMYEGAKKKLSERKAASDNAFLAPAAYFASTIPDIHLTSPGDVEKIKASYAYTLASSSNFPFSVAFKDLCRIKADATGSAPISRKFDEVKSIPASGRRLFARDEEMLVT